MMFTRRNRAVRLGMAAATLVGLSLTGRAQGLPESGTRVPFSFVQVCDPQLGTAGYKDDICSFEQAVKQINLLAPDFVLLCGDLVHKPNDTSISDFLLIREAFSVPCHLAPGNHDVDLDPTAGSLDRYRKRLGKDYYAFTHKGCRFIVVNTQFWKRQVEGETRRHDEWFVRELEAARDAGEDIFVAGHYPPFVEAENEPDRWPSLPPGKRQWVLRQFEQYGVRAMLTGHTHALSIHDYGGTQLVSGESISKNVDGRPLGFRLWQVGAAGRYEHAFVHLYKRELLDPKPPYDARIRKGDIGQCIGRLRVIDAAKEYIGMTKGTAPGSPVTWADIGALPGLRRRELKCPGGGSRNIGVLGVDPACSIAGHRLPYFYEFEEFKVRAADQKRLRLWIEDREGPQEKGEPAAQ